MTKQDPITKTLVPDSQRLDFMPEFVGWKRCVLFETLTYNWLARLSEDYKGGYWHFWSLSNGGMYISPRTPDKMRLIHGENYFDGEMSADAAGIVATLYAINGLSMRVPEDERENLARRYDALYDFACEHAEGQMILAAID